MGIKFKLKKIKTITGESEFKGYKEVEIKIETSKPMGIIYILLNDNGEVVDSLFQTPGHSIEFRRTFGRYEKAVKKYIFTKEFRMKTLFCEKENIEEFHVFKRYRNKQKLLKNQIEIFCLWKDSEYGRSISLYRTRLEDLTENITSFFDSFTPGKRAIPKEEGFIQELIKEGYNITIINSEEELKDIIKTDPR
ncbi:hypothetical protein [Bacillus cereus]|uniref:hypothetical protein n=1 Tax=Bacillus cereus TaxID=1396 RepID=UPI000BEE2867|nr:hypothetical protein [Bacillus cereus]PDY82774.1 hypothetical protein CON06_10240 [Bacillus cereus]